ncbi:MAG: 16S rRNA (cytidine(1402)-2'-O)-methyltransferase [Pseudomonadota bacterium]
MGNPKATDLSTLEPGLYLIATPIGAARDITLRALDILSTAEVLAAEDTRTLRKLMDIHGVALRDRMLISLHDHNARHAIPKLIVALNAGKSVAYASDAGTPLISDPGYDLTRAVIEAGLPLVSAPGPTAAITALTLSGLPADSFFFAGFLPSKIGRRKTALGGLRSVPGTLIFYESPKRAAGMLRDAAEVLGSERQAALCREITKKFEETLRGTLGDLAQDVAKRELKGEIVILVGRGDSVEVNQADLEDEIKAALKEVSVRDAADQIATKYGLKKRDVYQRALALNALEQESETE